MDDLNKFLEFLEIIDPREILDWSGKKASIDTFLGELFLKSMSYI